MACSWWIVFVSHSHVKGVETLELSASAALPFQRRRRRFRGRITCDVGMFAMSGNVC